ncbi:hypothetical protein OEZ86_009549 [Tetradesmus obliquus]|nr:hypothetical protein OEZ85_000995 [Tetradesmus obliquus]WIA43014.1 hypothetical protein OEZ86_009549 [Tetradesmus obliquus]
MGVRPFPDLRSSAAAPAGRPGPGTAGLMHAASAGAGSGFGGSSGNAGGGADEELPAPLTGKLQEPIRRLEEMRLVLESLQGQLLDTRVSLAVLEGRSLRLDNPMLLQRISALLTAAQDGEAEAAGAAGAAAMEVDVGGGAQGQEGAACGDGAVGVEV